MSIYNTGSKSYTVVFQVALVSPTYLSSPSPNGNQTEATMAATRSTWIPMSDVCGQNRDFNHGDIFTAYDYDAYYLKANYVYNATSNPNGILNVVSETL